MLRKLVKLGKADKDSKEAVDEKVVREQTSNGVASQICQNLYRNIRRRTMAKMTIVGTSIQPMKANTSIKRHPIVQPDLKLARHIPFWLPLNTEYALACGNSVFQTRVPARARVAFSFSTAEMLIHNLLIEAYLEIYGVKNVECITQESISWLRAWGYKSLFSYTRCRIRLSTTQFKKTERGENQA